MRYKGKLEKDGESWIVRYHGREIDITEDFYRLVNSEARALNDLWSRVYHVPPASPEDGVYGDIHWAVDENVDPTTVFSWLISVPPSEGRYTLKGIQVDIKRTTDKHGNPMTVLSWSVPVPQSGGTHEIRYGGRCPSCNQHVLVIEKDGCKSLYDEPPWVPGYDLPMIPHSCWFCVTGMELG